MLASCNSNHLPSPINGTVVDQDDFIYPGDLCFTDRNETVEESFNALFFIIARNDH